MSAYMFCKHKKSKRKLYVWAIHDGRYGHKQFIGYRNHCTTCGCLTGG